MVFYFYKNKKEGFYILMKLKEKFQQFMYGRYGTDEFSRFLLYFALALMVITLFVRVPLFNTLALALLVYCYFRMFSKNIYKRADENRMFLQKKQQFLNYFRKNKDHMDQMKEYRFFKCPNCKQKVRVPRGKGKIKIHCPRCHNDFIKKS